MEVMIILNPLYLYYLDSDLVPCQIVEPLFNEKWTGTYYENVPLLAEDYEWNDPDNPTELTCFLRKRVKFHDGTPFNAIAVKWNFDRLHRLLPNMT